MQAMKLAAPSLVVPVGLIAVILSVASLLWSVSLAAASPQQQPVAATVESISITSKTTDGVGLTIPYGAGMKKTYRRPSNSRYAAGDVVEFAVKFDQAVSVTGQPQLNVRVGSTTRTATYASTDGSTVLFEYTVADGESDHDGISVAANSLRQNGGTITGASGAAADLTHVALPAQSRHKVDGVAPRLLSVKLVSSTNTADKILTIGEEVFIKPTFSEAVRASIAGPPSITIQVGDEQRQAKWHSDSFGFYFRYFVQEGDLDLDGISIPANAIRLNGGTLQDMSGNHLVLANAAVPSNWEQAVDGVRPTVREFRIVSDPGDDRTYSPGDTIVVRVAFSEDVRIPEIETTTDEGNHRVVPALALNIGDEVRWATFRDESENNAFFVYQVQDGDLDENGVSIGANAISLTHHGVNGVVAMIRDAAGTSGWGANDAVLTHPAVRNNPSHKVGGQSSSDNDQDDGQQLEKPGTVWPINVAVANQIVTVSWGAPDHGGAVEQYVVRLGNANGNNRTVKKVDADTLSVTFNKKQKRGKTYRIEIFAKNAAGKGGSEYKYFRVPE